MIPLARVILQFASTAFCCNLPFLLYFPSVCFCFFLSFFFFYCLLLFNCSSSCLVQVFFPHFIPNVRSFFLSLPFLVVLVRYLPCILFSYFLLLVFHLSWFYAGGLVNHLCTCSVKGLSGYGHESVAGPLAPG